MLGVQQPMFDKSGGADAMSAEMQIQAMQARMMQLKQQVRAGPGAGGDFGEMFMQAQQAQQAQHAPGGGHPGPMQKKRKLCTHFIMSGQCPRNTECGFAHGEHEIGQPQPGAQQSAYQANVVSMPVLAQMQAAAAVGGPHPTHKKTRLCVHFSNAGQCPRGDTCGFAHGEEQIGMPQPAQMGQLGVAPKAADGAARCIGTISAIYPQKGFGFIKCDETFAVYGIDLWVHSAQLGLFNANDTVSFTLTTNKDGKPQAIDLQRAAPQGGGGMGMSYGGGGGGGGQQQGPAPCKFFLQGNCQKGFMCTFKHAGAQQAAANPMVAMMNNMIKGKGKGKPAAMGHVLPRTRISEAPFSGTVTAWKGKYGWIEPAETIEHEKAALHNGNLHFSCMDIVGKTELAAGAIVEFHITEDANGLGAEEVTEVNLETLLELDVLKNLA